MKRRYVWRGLYGGLAVLSLFVIAIIVQLALRYDGKCGGLFPFLAGPRPCSLWEHVRDSALLGIAILWIEYWPIVLALLVVPVGVGYVLDRRSRNA
jgi:hypothetical protein